jgi:YD repeat-containing protein
LLKQASETSDNEVAFFSSDSGAANEGKWPKLTVDYTEPAATPFDKIGDRPFFRYESQQLDDRMTAKVNVATGNLLLTGKDLDIAGTGLDAAVSRSYNSLDTSTDPSGLTPGWVLGDAPTVRLEFPGTAGRVTFVGPTGYRVRFDQNAGGGFAAAAPGIRADLTFDSSANEYRLKWWGSDAKWVFDGTTGHLKSRADRQGNTITYTYDASGRLDHLTDTQGRRINFSYNASTGLLESVTDVAAGRTYDYAYAQFPPGTGPTRLASVAVTSYGLGSDNVNLNAATSFGYDSSGRLTKITDPRGKTTLIGYDGTSGRVASITRVTSDTSDTDPVTTFDYTGSLADCNDTSASAITTVNGPRTDVSDVTKYCVDGQGRVQDTIDAQGHKRSFNYTSTSDVASFNETGVTGQGFNLTYDSSHNLTGSVLPTDGSSTASYNDPAHPHLPSGVRDFTTRVRSADLGLHL